MSLTTARLCSVAGVSRDALNKIMDPARGGLATPIPATAPGAARAFTRENGLEVAFIAALGRLGMVSYTARSFAAAWTEKAASGRLERYWTWNPRDDNGLGLELVQIEYTEPIPYPDLAFMLADSGPDEPTRPAAELVTLDRLEIVRRVDACFEDVFP